MVTKDFLEEGRWDDLLDREQSPGEGASNGALVSVSGAGLGP